MDPNELERENNPLLDDDEVVDFLLYQDMNRQSRGERPKSGCLAGVTLCIIVPMTSILYWLL